MLFRSDVTVRDDNGTPGNPADDFSPTFIGGDANGNGLLDTTETWTYTQSATALAGQQTNTGTVTAQDPNTGTTVTGNNPANHFGDALGTFDFNFDNNGDGHGDILWQNDNGAVAIWDNGLPAGGHTVANPGVVPSSYHIVDTGDFDGNHQSDILWQSDDGAVAIWDNGLPAGGHTVATSVPASWHIAGVGDFDANHQSDILWQNDDGSVAIWDNGLPAGGHVVANAGAVASDWHLV